MEKDRRRLLGSAVALDVALALVLVLVGLVSLWSPSPVLQVDLREPDAFGVTLVVLGSAAVAVRRRIPLVALFVSLVSSVLLLHLGYHQVGGGLTALLVLYTVATQKSVRVSAAWTALTVLASSLAVLTGPYGQTPADLVANTLIFITAWAVGRSVRARRARIASLEEGGRALAAAHEAEARAALAEERSTIAREMQDLVAHKLAELTVQVAASGRLVRRDPETAEQVLADAERTSRLALEEMRRILDMLAPGEGLDERRPLPGLDDVEHLVDSERSAGLAVRFACNGPTHEVPSGVGLTSYRVVQESLALLRRRSPSHGVQVKLDWGPDRLAVCVCDDGPDTGLRAERPEGANAGGGSESIGLRLLQRRAELYGGRLVYDADGAVAVTAEFPLREEERGR